MLISQLMKAEIVEIPQIKIKNKIRGHLTGHL